MRRPLLAAAMLALATGAGIATASALMPESERFETAPQHLLPGPAQVVVGARAPDPGGGPDWAVRTYVSRTGGLCAELGRLRGGVFGDVGADGAFVPRAEGATGTCAGDPAEPLVAAIRHSPATQREAARTVLFGASARGLRELRVSPRGEPDLDLAVGARGSFVAAFAGTRPEQDLPLAARFRDGAAQRVDWSGTGEP
jgi:hypothetical protein